MTLRASIQNQSTAMNVLLNCLDEFHCIRMCSVDLDSSEAN